MLTHAHTPLIELKIAFLVVKLIPSVLHGSLKSSVLLGVTVRSCRLSRSPGGGRRVDQCGELRETLSQNQL